MVGEFTRFIFCNIPYSKCAGQGLTCVENNSGKPIYSCTHSSVPTGCMYARWLTVSHEGSSLRLTFESCLRNFKPLPCDIPIPQTFTQRKATTFTGQILIRTGPWWKVISLPIYLKSFLVNGWKQIPSKKLSHFFKRYEWLYSQKRWAGSKLHSDRIWWNRQIVGGTIFNGPSLIWLRHLEAGSWRGIKRYKLLNFWQPVAASHVFQ